MRFQVPLCPTLMPEQVVKKPLYGVTTAFTDITEEAVIWLWRQPEGRIIPAGVVVTIAGNGGAGKSTFLAWVAARLSRGTLPGDYEGKPSKVIWISGEDNPSQVLKPRFMAAGADMSKIYSFTMANTQGQELTPVFARDVEELADQIYTHDPKLVVIDPVTSFFGGNDMYKSTDVRDNFFTPLSQVASDTGCTIALVTHLNKGGEGKSVGKVLGSEAFTNAARAVINFKADEENPGWGVFSLVKFNLGSERGLSYNYQIEPAKIESGETFIESSRFALRDQSAKTVDELFSEDSDGIGRTALEDARGFIVALLESEGGKMQRASLIKAAKRDGHSERTCVRVLEMSKAPWIKSYRVKGRPPVTMWELSATDPASNEKQAA